MLAIPAPVRSIEDNLLGMTRGVGSTASKMYEVEITEFPLYEELEDSLAHRQAFVLT